MKGKLFIASIIFFWTVVCAKAQQFTVFYQATFDVTSPTFMLDSDIPKEMRGLFSTAMKDFVINFELAYNNGESAFYVSPIQKQQSISIMGQTIDGDVFLSQYKNNYDYKNFNKNLYIHKVDFGGKIIIIKDSIDCETFEIIQNEEKEILGFDCKKAISSDKKTTLWFSEYLPIHDGPITGKNVDGFVLEACDGNNIYTAVKIEERITSDIIEPKDGKTMSMSQFKEYSKKIQEMQSRNNMDIFE